MTGPAALVLAALAVAGAAPDAPPADPSIPPAAAFAAAGPDAAHDLLILGEGRPVRVRVRTLVAGRPLRLASRAAAQALRDRLDRDHDGKLTPVEAEAGGLPLFGPTPPGATGGNRPRPELDADKDGDLGVDEVLRALGGAAGAFRVAGDGKPERRTDALFDHLDRDRDGFLTRPELDSLAGTLRRLDRDNDEWIALGEVAGTPGGATPGAMMGGMAPGRAAPREAVPAVVAIQPDESPLRVVRLLVRRYDTTGRTPGSRPDGKLARDEFALPAAAFDALDANHDQALSGDELRRYVADGTPDAALDVDLPGDPAGPARVALRAEDGGVLAVGAVRVLADDLVELEVGPLRVDFQVDPGLSAREAARRRLQALFRAADTTQDGYLDADEASPDGQPGPFAALHPVLDRDGDGKVYRDDVDRFIDHEADAARGRLALDVADEGRALFGLLDPDGDRRLGAREVLDTFRRVSACDGDRDGRVGPDEIPHQVHVALNQGEIPPLGLSPAAPAVVAVANPGVGPASRATPRAHLGPDWFRKMDRNHDGDVSRREFLGTHAQFDRLDLDHDGLLAPTEADAATKLATP